MRARRHDSPILPRAHRRCRAKLTRARAKYTTSNKKSLHRIDREVSILHGASALACLRDATAVRPLAASLARLIRLSEMAITADNFEACWHCGLIPTATGEERNKLCGRCKDEWKDLSKTSGLSLLQARQNGSVACYCSKDCQIKDWQTHKPWHQKRKAERRRQEVD